MRLFLRAAREVGVSREELARIPGAGSAGENGIRLPTSSILRLWEVSSAALGEAGGGTRVMELWSPGRFHVWDYLFSTAGTLTEGFRTAAQHLPVLADPEDAFEVTVDGAGRLKGTYRGLHADLPEAPMIGEYAAGIMLREARAATGRAIVPVSVVLPYPPPRAHDRLVETFGTRDIDFHDVETSITFAAADAVKPLPGSDPTLAAIMENYASTAITTARPILGWLDKVHAEIGDALHQGTPSLDRVAHRLAMSPRTLQRRLREEGTTWRNELERIRDTEAARLLRETSLGIDSIATRVGYGDVRALRRTFHRLHGHTPSTYRNQHAA